MLRLMTIIAVWAMGCANPSASNKLKQDGVMKDTLSTGSSKMKEVITNSIDKETDTAYNNIILSYKDSVDNQSRVLKKVNKKIEGSSEGGEAILYLLRKDTLKMDITFYGETGKSAYAFYFRDRDLVFYIGTTIFYTEPISISKDIKTDSITVDKIILRNNTIVSWLHNDSRIIDKYEMKAQEVRDLYNEIQDLIK